MKDEGEKATASMMRASPELIVGYELLVISCEI